MPFLPVNEQSLAIAVDEDHFHVTRCLPLILTKFSPPRPPGVLLPRERLLLRLDNAHHCSLTLVCAPAGFGKTTLLAQWYARRKQRGDNLAWLSLEREENTPDLFMRYMLEALRPLYHGWSLAFQRYFAGNLPANFALLIAELINQLHYCPHSLFLILDDYHCITHPEINQGLTYLLQHAPAALHVIIGSRHQPSLSPGRLEINDQLLEITEAELRFTRPEASIYFSTSPLTPLDNQAALRLFTMTEGWIAGMKMAALSSKAALNGQEQDNAACSGSMTRYIEEVVLAPLPASVLNFLMLTSVLNRLHPALCDALTGRNDGGAMLEWLTAHNLFLSPLDSHGLWFRAHPLMRDTLLKRLERYAAGDIPRLHERAAKWFFAQKLWAEALRHALEADKPADSHAELGVQSLAEEGDINTMVRWLQRVPTALDQPRTELQINLAWALAHRFRFTEARQLLDSTEQQLGENLGQLKRSLWIKLRVVRAICEAFADNIAQSIALVEPLLAEVPCGDVWVDGLVCNILSYCHLAASRPQQALTVQQRRFARQQATRNLFVEVYRAYVLAEGYMRQGNLIEAEHQASQAFHHAGQHIGTDSSSGATLAPLLAEIAWERGETMKIEELLRPRLNMIDDFCPPAGLSHCYIVLAKQAVSKGKTAQAIGLLEHADRLALQRGWLRARIPLLSEQLSVYLAAGKRKAAEEVLSELQGLAAEATAKDGPLLHWSVNLGISKLLLADNRPLAAGRLLEQLVNEQEQHGEWLSALRSRLLLAIAWWQAERKDKAIAVCQPAVERARQQKLYASLHHVARALQPILDALPHPVPGTERPPTDSAGSVRLTEREQQTLDLIALGHSNKHIARQLGISAETVKWHVKQLYDKLDAGSRIQAINQARKSGLLT